MSIICHNIIGLTCESAINKLVIVGIFFYKVELEKRIFMDYILRKIQGPLKTGLQLEAKHVNQEFLHIHALWHSVYSSFMNFS